MSKIIKIEFLEAEILLFQNFRCFYKLLIDSLKLSIRRHIHKVPADTIQRAVMNMKIGQDFWFKTKGMLLREEKKNQSVINSH